MATTSRCRSTTRHSLPGTCGTWYQSWCMCSSGLDPTCGRLCAPPSPHNAGRVGHVEPCPAAFLPRDLAVADLAVCPFLMCLPTRRNVGSLVHRKDLRPTLLPYACVASARLPTRQQGGHVWPCPGCNKTFGMMTASSMGNACRSCRVRVPSSKLFTEVFSALSICHLIIGCLHAYGRPLLGCFCCMIGASWQPRAGLHPYGFGCLLDTPGSSGA